MQTLSCHFIVSIVLVFSMLGCAGINPTGPKLALNPLTSTFSSLIIQGEFSGEAHAQDDVAEMSIFYLKLRNDTAAAKSVSLARAVGVTSDQKTVSPLPRGEAEYQLIDSQPMSVWAGAATGTTVGALSGATIGGAMGAIVGAIIANGPGAAAGAAVFAAVGGVTGAITGAAAGGLRASSARRPEHHPHARILERQLSDQIIQQASQAEGYVFLPKDKYSYIKLIVSSEAEDDQELTIPVALTN